MKYIDAVHSMKSGGKRLEKMLLLVPILYSPHYLANVMWTIIQSLLPSQVDETKD